MPEQIPAFLAETFQPLKLAAPAPTPGDWRSSPDRSDLPSIAVSTDAGSVASDDDGPVGGFASTSNQLDLRMETQKHTNWCWAAVGVCVANFLDGGAGWTQCKLATRVTGKDCCGGYTDACNMGQVLSAPLIAVGVYDDWQRTPLPYRRVKDCIEKGLPVCCFIDWRDGSPLGHFVVVGGWFEGESGTAYVEVFDPKDGAMNHVIYNRFVQGGYRSTRGQWAQSYLVKKPAGRVPTS